MSATCEQRVEHLLRIGDTPLILAQRLAEWVGSAPTLEEELALANTALDLLGQATFVLEHAAQLEDAGRSADDLAFLRESEQFRNVLLAELPNGDFAVTTTRQLIYAAYARELWAGLATSTDDALVGIAAKAAKETDYHLQHASQWFVRLALGTDESRQRMIDAVERLWPYTAELFEDDDLDHVIAGEGIAPLPSALRSGWHQLMTEALLAAELTEPGQGWSHTGGRRGAHTEALSYLLAEMQVLQRTHPGVGW